MLMMATLSLNINRNQTEALKRLVLRSRSRPLVIAEGWREGISLGEFDETAHLGYNAEIEFTNSSNSSTLVDAMIKYLVYNGR